MENLLLIRLHILLTLRRTTGLLKSCCLPNLNGRLAGVFQEPRPYNLCTLALSATLLPQARQTFDTSLPTGAGEAFFLAFCQRQVVKTADFSLKVMPI